MSGDNLASMLGNVDGKLDMLIQQVHQDRLESKAAREIVAQRVAQVEQNQQDLLERDRRTLDQISKLDDRVVEVEKVAEKAKSWKSQFTGGMIVLGFVGTVAATLSKHILEFIKGLS